MGAELQLGRAIVQDMEKGAHRITVRNEIFPLLLTLLVVGGRCQSGDNLSQGRK